MIYKIIIILSALFGIFQLFRIKDNFSKAIIIVQIIAFGLTFIPGKNMINTALVLYMLTLLTVIYYASVHKDFTVTKRILMIIPTIMVFLVYLFQLHHYPGAAHIAVLLPAPVLVYIYIVFADLKNYKNELGFLTIIAIDAAVEFVIRLPWIMS